MRLNKAFTLIAALVIATIGFFAATESASAISVGTPCDPDQVSACGNNLNCHPTTKKCGEFRKEGSKCSTSLKNCDAGLECKKSGGYDICISAGKTGVGESCTSDSQCVSGTVCIAGAASFGSKTCTTRKKDGEQCQSTGSLRTPDARICDDGLVCNTSTNKCQALGVVGGECVDDSYCDAKQGLKCDDEKKCRKDAGASCNTSEECPINYATKGDATKPKYRYFCDQTTKTCKVSTEQGGSLGYECKEGINSCAQGLKCVKNKCAVGENNDAGARCENESQCKDPLRCISQKCAVAPKKIGDECAKNEDCPRNASCKTLTADTKKVCKQDRPVTGTDNPDNATASATPISVQCSNNVADRGYFTTGLTNECINCGRCTICDFMNVIQGVINGILGVVGLIAMFMLILGAGTYTNAAGNPKKMEAAKAQITTAIIGLLIAIGSWAIVTAVMRGLSASATGTWYRPKFECRADAWKSQSILNRTP